LRAKVVNAIKDTQADVAHFESKGNVEVGDWILVMSDGVSDNFIEGEIEDFVNKAIERDWSPEALTQKISQALDERISLASKNDPIARRNHYKMDNATIIAMRVNQLHTDVAAVAA
jgi:serine/threonine protein phosphatase PrpC